MEGRRGNRGRVRVTYGGMGQLEQGYGNKGKERGGGTWCRGKDGEGKRDRERGKQGPLCIGEKGREGQLGQRRESREKGPVQG